MEEVVELWVRIGEPVREPGGRRLGTVDAVVAPPTLERMTHVSVAEASWPHAGRLVAVSELRPGDGCLELDSDHWPSGYQRTYELAFAPSQDQLQGYPVFPFDYEDVLVLRGAPMPSGPLNVIREHLPEGEVALHVDSSVRAADGHIGTVGGLLTGPSGEVTHVLLRHGHLWGRRTVILPVELIEQVRQDELVVRPAIADLDRYAIE